MLNLKLFGFCVIVVALALVFADNDAGASGAAKAAKEGDFGAVADIKGQVYCPAKNDTDAKNCGEGSFAHYHTCCGDGEKECCFALQIWVYIVLAVIVLAMIISTIVGIVCCCCKK